MFALKSITCVKSCDEGGYGTLTCCWNYSRVA